MIRKQTLFSLSLMLASAAASASVLYQWLLEKVCLGCTAVGGAHTSAIIRSLSVLARNASWSCDVTRGPGTIQWKTAFLEYYLCFFHRSFLNIKPRVDNEAAQTKSQKFTLSIFRLRRYLFGYSRAALFLNDRQSHLFS
uniref:Putative secreted protein n=1 Tax=Amblyomma triste TaxID=251400 RepID=A0A023G107_AMBTT